jgi:hypothetical protein
MIYDVLWPFSTFSRELEVPLQALIIQGPCLAIQSLVKSLDLPV